MALIERRRNLLAYNLTGPRRMPHFLTGLAAGFVALSALVGASGLGRLASFWPHRALRGADLQVWRTLGSRLSAGGLRGRGYLPLLPAIHLTRGLNFWWALGIVASLSAASDLP